MSGFPTRALTAAIAAGLLAAIVSPPVSADPGHGPMGHKPQGHDQQRGGPDRPGPSGQWRQGQHFDARYATRYQAIDYRRYHGLRAPPRGYHWVRSGNDAVLVAITTGIVASVIANAAR